MSYILELCQPLLDLIREEPGLTLRQLLRRYEKLEPEIKQRHLSGRLSRLCGAGLIASVGSGRQTRWYPNKTKVT